MIMLMIMNKNMNMIMIMIMIMIMMTYYRDIIGYIVWWKTSFETRFLFWI